MTQQILNFEEALLLTHFEAAELKTLSDRELAYLATIDDCEELPPEGEEQFSHDEWKELLIRFIECYDEAKAELASKTHE